MMCGGCGVVGASWLTPIPTPRWEESIVGGVGCQISGGREGVEGDGQLISLLAAVIPATTTTAAI